MSYPHVDWVVRNFKLPKNTKPIVLFNQEPSVEQAIELVRRNILNQIDGRDLARINALEADNDKLAYTVSKEQAAVWYEKRHLHADFNSRNLVNQMVLKWGKTVRFHQVILDYFWSPSGSWAIKSWQRSFFNENIPNFVTHKLFNFGSLDKDTTLVKASSASKKKKKRKDDTYVTSDAAVVYLPFSSHCFRQVVACYENLSKFYTISFLKKEDLDEHTLWKATNTISPSSMQVWLAKSIDQEEKYCKLDYSEIRGFSDDEFATREDIINIFNRIAEPDEVRMIKLMALRKYHPDYPSSNMKPDKPTLGIDKGGYVGLIHPSEVVLRRTPSPTDGIVTKKGATKEAGTITGVDADPLKESNSAVPRFILSLAELLDRKNRKIIELLPDGITIHDEGGLENELLPNFFTPGSLINFKNTLRKYKFRRTEKKTFTHDALDKDMNVQSLLQITKNGFVRGSPPSVDQLYNNVFGPNGRDITVAVSDQNFKELMFYHYKMLGKKPAIGLPRQLGQEIFKKLQAKVKKSGGHFLNGKGEKIDVDKAARKVMRCLYLRMDTFADWKDYEFSAQEDDVSDDESEEKRQSYTITASAETELLSGMANQMSKWKADKKEKSPQRGQRGCKHKGCGKPVFARGFCYRHDREAKRGVLEVDSSSDDEDENIYVVRPPMRTIGTQTDDLPLVSDTSGHYAASVASYSSSSSDNTAQARGLPKDDTTVDENSSSSSDSIQKPEPVRRKQHHRAKHAPDPEMPWPDMWRFMRDDGWSFLEGGGKQTNLCDFIYLHPSVKGQKKLDILSTCVEGEDYFTSEGSVMLYARKFLGWRGAGGPESEFPTVLTPIVARTEHRRKSKQRSDRGGSAAIETETDQESEVTEKLDLCTPNTNDVLLVAGHHSHMGNVQFCNAVSMCNADFSDVPECFSAALKSLSPPGRFLVKAVSDGGWKEISNDLAPSIIPLIMDHHKLHGAHLYRRESLSFLARVEQIIESKYGGRPMVAKVSGASSTLPEASLPGTAAVAAPTPAATQPAKSAIAVTGASTKEAITNRCVAQTLRTFNIWHDENWRNTLLTAFGVDTAKLGQNGTSLSDLSAEDLSQILEQSSLSAHTLLTCVLDAEVKSLVTSNN
eukprot:scaffold3933_cov155-Skeletonema_menzelii.AAC.2